MRVGSGVILFQLAGFLTSALADFYFAKHTLRKGRVDIDAPDRAEDLVFQRNQLRVVSMLSVLFRLVDIDMIRRMLHLLRQDFLFFRRIKIVQIKLLPVHLLPDRSPG